MTRKMILDVCWARDDSEYDFSMIFRMGFADGFCGG